MTIMTPVRLMSCRSSLSRKTRGWGGSSAPAVPAPPNTSATRRSQEIIDPKYGEIRSQRTCTRNDRAFSTVITDRFSHIVHQPETPDVVLACQCSHEDGSARRHGCQHGPLPHHGTSSRAILIQKHLDHRTMAITQGRDLSLRCHGLSSVMLLLVAKGAGLLIMPVNMVRLS